MQTYLYFRRNRLHLRTDRRQRKEELGTSTCCCCSTSLESHQPLATVVFIASSCDCCLCSVADPERRTALSRLRHSGMQNFLRWLSNLFLGPLVAIRQPRPLCFAAVSLFFLQREISAVSRPISAKLCHMIGNGCNFKNYVQNLGVLPPKKLGPKNMLFRRDLRRLRSSIANIFRTEQDIRKRKTTLETIRSLPRPLT